VLWIVVELDRCGVGSLWSWIVVELWSVWSWIVVELWSCGVCGVCGVVELWGCGVVCSCSRRRAVWIAYVLVAVMRCVVIGLRVKGCGSGVVVDCVCPM